MTRKQFSCHRSLHPKTIYGSRRFSRVNHLRVTKFLTRKPVAYQHVDTKMGDTSTVTPRPVSCNDLIITTQVSNDIDACQRGIIFTPPLLKVSTVAAAKRWHCQRCLVGIWLFGRRDGVAHHSIRTVGGPTKPLSVLSRGRLPQERPQ